MGFPDWWLDNWGADAEDVTSVFAYDEQGQAAAWVKRYGGPVGTGFIRVFAGDAREHPQLMSVLQTAAELRPRCLFGQTTHPSVPRRSLGATRSGA